MTEYLLLTTLGLAAATVYSMYRYFNDLTASCHDIMMKDLDRFNNVHTAELELSVKESRNRSNGIEQKLYDGLQSNSICSKSAIDKIHSDLIKIKNRLSSLENSSDKISRKRDVTVIIPKVKE